MQQHGTRGATRRSRETATEAGATTTPSADVEALAGGPLAWVLDWGLMGVSLGVLPLLLSLLGFVPLEPALLWAAAMTAGLGLLGAVLCVPLKRTRHWGLVKQTVLAALISALVFWVLSAPVFLPMVPRLADAGISPMSWVLGTWGLAGLQTGALVGPLWIPYAAARVTRTPRRMLLVAGPWLWVGVILLASALFGF